MSPAHCSDALNDDLFRWQIVINIRYYGAGRGMLWNMWPGWREAGCGLLACVRGCVPGLGLRFICAHAHIKFGCVRVRHSGIIINSDRGMLWDMRPGWHAAGCSLLACVCGCVPGLGLRFIYANAHIKFGCVCVRTRIL